MMAQHWQQREPRGVLSEFGSDIADHDPLFRIQRPLWQLPSRLLGADLVPPGFSHRLLDHEIGLGAVVLQEDLSSDRIPIIRPERQRTIEIFDRGVHVPPGSNTRSPSAPAPSRSADFARSGPLRPPSLARSFP